VQETLVLTLTLNGTAAASLAVNVSGAAPAYLDPARSLASARLVGALASATGPSGPADSTSRPAQTTTAALAAGSQVSVPIATTVTLEVPVVTLAGTVWPTDAGLAASVLLVPAAVFEDATSDAAAAVRAAMRRVLRARRDDDEDAACGGALGVAADDERRATCWGGERGADVSGVVYGVSRRSRGLLQATGSVDAAASDTSTEYDSSGGQSYLDPPYTGA
jgi:hypothetical protein